MATLYIREYAQLATGPQTGGAGSITPQAQEPGLDQTPITIGAGSLQSAAFQANTRFVRISTDVVCSIAFGTNPTATANGGRMPANTTEYFGVSPGHKVAVITNT